MRILLVEDDITLTEVLSKSLIAQNYSVDAVSDGTTAWEYLSHIEYDLILLDVLLPKLDGVSLCRRLRAEEYETPILILTAQHESRARVRALDAGADDYLVKPFDFEELMARVRALIRRGGRELSPIVQFGQLVFDPVHCAVSYAGIPLSLSAKEYALLDLFFHAPQHVFSIPELIDSLWCSEEYPAEATVRSHIRRLRHKLIEAGAPQDFISNVHGRGYFLKADLDESDTDTTSIIDEQQLQSPHKPNAILQEQYQTFLEETWQKFQPKALLDFHELKRLLNSLKDTQPSLPDLKQAQLIAHRLKGTLGVFHQIPAMQSAQDIESYLEIVSNSASQDHNHGAIHQKITTCLLVIEKSLLTSYDVLFEDPLVHNALNFSFLYIHNDNSLFREESLLSKIDAVAESLHLSVIVKSNFASAAAWLFSENPPKLLPSGIIVFLNLDPTQIEELERFNKQLKNEVSTCYIPIFVITQGVISFEMRLRILRAGATHFLNHDPSILSMLQTSLKLISHKNSPMKALMVDDDECWLQSMTFQLQSFGYQVTGLTKSKSFWEILEETQPDIVVLDLRMPDVNGLELCQALRSDTHWHTLPIIVVTALEDTQAQSLAFSLGADDYLCKPVQGSDLAHRMVTRLKRTRALIQQEI